MTNILSSLTKLHLSTKPVTITFVNFAVSGLTLIHQLPVPLLPLPFTPNLITVILSTINSISLHYPVSSRSRILARTVVKAPKPCHSTPILCSLHWLRITERIEYKLLLLTYQVLTTTQPPYFHNLTSVQRPRSTPSSSIVTLALKITDLSFRYALPCLWNQLPLSLHQPHSGTSSLFPTHLFLHPSVLPLLIHHSSIIPTLFYSQLKTYLFHKSL